MYIRNVLFTTLAAASSVQAFNGSFEAFNIAEETPSAVDNSKRTLGSLLNFVKTTIGGLTGNKPATCPAIWSEISTTLTGQFLADGECTDAARAAIRGSFHDCFAGACDGSLILADECSKPENRGLERLCGNLANVAAQTKVGVADLIQFAAAHAIKTCPGGPTVPVKVGRKDSATANDVSLLPGGTAASGDLIKLFGKHFVSKSNTLSLTTMFSIQGLHPHGSRRTDRRAHHR